MPACSAEFSELRRNQQKVRHGKRSLLPDHRCFHSPRVVMVSAAQEDEMDVPSDDVDARLAFDPWTKADGSEARAVQPVASRPPRAVVKSLAEGTLHLWERGSLRFNSVDCTISEDVHGVWCLLAHDHHLRVPLASICMVKIVSVSRMQFRVVRFGACVPCPPVSCPHVLHAPHVLSSSARASRRVLRVLRAVHR